MADNYKILLQTVLDSNSAKSINNQLNNISKNLNDVPIKFNMDKAELNKIRKEMDSLMESMYGKNYNTTSTKIDSAIKEAEKSSKKFSSQLKEQMQQRQKDEHAAKKQSDAQDKLNFKLQEFKKLNLNRLDTLSNKKGIDTSEIDKLKNKILELDPASEKVSEEMKSLSNDISILGRTAGDNSVSINKMIGLYFGLNEAIGVAKKSVSEMIDTIITLDKTLTNIQIVTDMDDSSIKNLSIAYNQLGQQYAATTNQVLTGAEEWFRQGKSVAETQELVTASIVGSKLAGNEAAQMTQYLTSALNGYKLESKNAINVVDKLVAVDNAAATSVDELAISMSKTANTARLAGVDIDTLIGYIGTVSSVTRKEASSIGDSFKSMFSRFQNLKIGKFVDGETISDVRKVLDSVGISIMKNETEFRSYKDVIEEVNASWETFSGVQRSAIAQAMAGTYQRENFLVLMENMEMATDLATVSIESQGLAIDRYGIYIDSIEAKINKFKAATDSLFMNSLSSDTVKTIVDIGTATIKLVDKVGLLNTSLLATATYMSFSKNSTIVSGLSAISSGFSTLASTIGMTNVALLGTVGLIGGGIAVGSLIFDKTTTSVKELKDKSEKLKTEISELTEEYNTLDSVANRTEAQETKLNMLKDEIELRREISKEIDSQLAKENLFGNNLKQILSVGFAGQGEIKNSENVSSKLFEEQIAYTNLKKSLDDSNLSLEEEYELKGKIGDKRSSAISQLDSLITSNDKLKDTLNKVNDGQITLNESEKQALQNRVYSNDKIIENSSSMLGLSSSIEQVTDATNDYIESTGNETDYVDEQAKAIEELIEKIENLQDTYANTTSSISDLKAIQEEYNKYGKISQDSMNKIISKFPELLSAMGDEATFREMLIERIGEQKSAQETALTELTLLQSQYAQDIKQIDGELYEELLQYYQTYSENYAAAMSGQVDAWGKMEQAKADITSTLISKLGEAWSGYFSAIAQGFDALGSSISTISDNKIVHSSDFSPDQWNSMSGLEKQAITNMENTVRTTTEAGKQFVSVGKALHDVVSNFDTGGIEISIPVSTDLGDKSGGGSKGSKSDAEKQIKEAFDAQIKLIKSKGEEIQFEIDKLEAKISLNQKIGLDTTQLEQDLINLTDAKRKATEEENKSLEALKKTFTGKEQLAEIEKLMSDNSLRWFDQREETYQKELEYVQKLAEAEREIYDDRINQIDSQQRLLDETSDTYYGLELEKLEILKFKQESYAREIASLKAKNFKDESDDIKKLQDEYDSLQDSIIDGQIKTIQIKLEMNLSGLDQKLRELEIEQMLASESDSIELEEKRADIMISKREETNNAIQKLLDEGFTYEDKVVSDLVNTYYDYQKNIISIYKKIGEDKKKLLQQSYQKELDEAKTSQDAIKNLLDMTISMLKQKYSDQKDSINEEIKLREEAVSKELDGIKKVADERKNALRKQSDERSYKKDLEKKQKDIKKIEDKIAELQFDTSAKGVAERKKLEEELAKQREDLEDLQYENSIKKQEEIIDEELKLQEEKLNKELESFKKEKDAELKALEDYLSKEGNIRNEAMELIQNKNSDLYNQLMQWADEYATFTKDEVTDAWQLATNALDKFGSSGESVYSILGNIADKMKDITDEMSKLDNSSWKDFVDEDDYSPNNPTDKPSEKPTNKPGDIETESKPTMSESEAKKKEQENQQKYLHKEMVKAKDTGNKQLENWIKKERPSWGLNPDTGAIEGNISSSKWNEVKHKYGFYKGGETEATGLHWVDGVKGKPERILSAEQTKAFNELVLKHMPSFNINMDKIEKMVGKINPPSYMAQNKNESGDININAPMVELKIDGDVTESMLPKIRELADDISDMAIEKLNNVMSNRGHGRSAKALSI